MKKTVKMVGFILTAAMLFGMAAAGASAAGGAIVTRVLFVNPGAMNEIVAATDTEPEYKPFTVNIDGELETIKVLKEPGWGGAMGYPGMPWFGVFNATINADGYCEKLVADTSLVQGFVVNAPEDGKIVLGVFDDAYTFAEDARVFLGSKDTPVDTLEIKPEEIKDAWDSGYWLEMNEDYEIQTMYISLTANYGQKNIPYTDNAAKFRLARGPEASDGVSIRYNYYEPEVEGNEKYPLLIWFHGNGCGQYDWQAMFDYNPIANFASDEFQEAFSAGGAYIMTPSANELYLEEGVRSNWREAMIPGFFAALDDYIGKNPNIDTDRIYVGGFSMGGLMTWLAIRERPTFFAAAFPNCPAGMAVPLAEDIDELSKFSALPIWQVHGIGDPIVPSAVSTGIMPFFDVEAARTGTDTRFSLWAERFIVPDGTVVPLDHLSWAVTLNNMKMNDGSLYLDKDGVPVESTLIEWLNDQARSANLERAEAAEAVREAAFTDVNAGNWFYNYVSMLSEGGVVSGIGGRLFAPNSVATFGQTLKMVMLATGYEELDPTGEHWASGYLDAAIADGLVDEGEYDLNAPVSRLSVARIAALALDITASLTESPFPDTDDPAVLALYEAKVVAGNDKGEFLPDGNLTRAELSKIVLLLMLK